MLRLFYLNEKENYLVKYFLTKPPNKETQVGQGRNDEIYSPDEYQQGEIDKVKYREDCWVDQQQVLSKQNHHNSKLKEKQNHHTFRID